MDFLWILWSIPTDTLVPIDCSRLMGRPVRVWVHYGLSHIIHIPRGIPCDIAWINPLVYYAMQHKKFDGARLETYDILWVV